MATNTSRHVVVQMEKEMMDQIKQMGFEQYIAKVHAKYQLMGGLKMLLSAFFFGAVAFLAPMLLMAGEDGMDLSAGLVIGIRVVGALLIIGGCVAYGILYSPAKRKAGLVAYKEKLTKRHGDYKKILKAVEEQLVPVIYRTECGTYITEDWLIILDARRPVSFTHKSEVAALIGTNAGTVLVWDDGEFDPDMYFGNNQWSRVFMMIAEKNPYILTNRDFFENKSRQMVSIGTTTKHFAKSGEDNGKLVARQFLKNKQEEKLPVW